jgi:hypothetical protein
MNSKISATMASLGPIVTVEFFKRPSRSLDLTKA